jgi:uncharacterized membrane protein YhfC
MVSTASILFMCVTLFLSLLLPLIVLLVLQKGRRGVFSVWIAGALGFAVPQLFIRIPLLQTLGTQESFQQFIAAHPYVTVSLMAATAALFETTGRLVVLKVALSKRLSYMTGLAAGAGHGGIEAIAIVGMLYINNLIISLSINSGNLTSLLPADPAIAESIRQSLVGTPPELFLLAGFERVLTMVIQVALSIILTLFIMKNRAIFGFLVVALLHFSVDVSIGLLQINGWSALAIERLIFLIAIVSLLAIINLRPAFGDRLEIPVDLGEQAVNEGY